MPLSSARFDDVGDHLEIGSDIRSVLLPGDSSLSKVMFHTPEGNHNEYEIDAQASSEGRCYNLPAGVSGFVEHIETTYTE